MKALDKLITTSPVNDSIDEEIDDVDKMSIKDSRFEAKMM